MNPLVVAHICILHIILLVLLDSPFRQVVSHLLRQVGERNADRAGVLVHEHLHALQLVVGYHLV